MPVYLIPDEVVFPHPLVADQSGILGVGGDLAPDRVLLAYQFGIFPWYSEMDPLLWWFPDPRSVLFPDQIRIQKSMRTYFNKPRFTLTADTCFDAVITACQWQERAGQTGTWINEALKRTFQQLHVEGYAHSIEVWEADKLVGGLYGMALGRIFFGESMFSQKPNASKYALIRLAQFLGGLDFVCIDCQQDTPHLRRMGATVIPKEKFYAILKENLFAPHLRHSWSRYFTG